VSNDKELKLEDDFAGNILRLGDEEKVLYLDDEDSPLKLEVEKLIPLNLGEEVEDNDDLVLLLPDERESTDLSILPIGGEISVDLVLPEEEPDEDLLRFLAGTESTELLLPEEEEDTSDSMTIFGGAYGLTERHFNQPAPVTASELATSYESSLEVLRATLSVSSVSAEEDSRTLGEMVEQANLPFLSAIELATLVPIIYKTQDRESILKEFHAEAKRSFKSPEMLKLVTEIEKISMNFKKYMSDNASSKRVLRDKTLSSDTIMASIENDLKELMFNSYDAVYVSKVGVSSEGYSFSCGKCNEVSQTETGFLNVVVHEHLGGDKGALMNVFPRACKCDYCGTPNILTHLEHNKISAQLNLKYRDDLSKWFSVTPSRRITADENVIEYTPEAIALSVLCPEVFYLTSMPVEELEEDRTDPEEVHKWFLETEKLLHSLRSLEPKTSGGYVAGTTSVVPNREDQFLEIEAVCRGLSKSYNHDFEGLMTKASSSVLLYLKSKPLLLSLFSLQPEWILLRSMCYSTYDLNSLAADTIANMMKSIGVVPAKTKKANIVKLKEVIQESSVKLEEGKSPVLEETLNELLPLAHSIPLLNVSEIDVNSFEELLADPVTSEWIRKASLVIVLNILSKEYRHLWETKAICKYKFKSLFSDRAKTALTKRLDLLTKALAKEFYPFADDFKVFRGKYTCATYWTVEALQILDDLEYSLERLDVYKFHETVKRFQSVAIPDQASPLVKLRSEILKSTEFLSQNSPEDLLGYFVFHYGSQFTQEEISSSLGELPGRLKAENYYLREEGESFSDYYKRCNEKIKDVTSVAIPDPSSEYLKEYTHHYITAQLCKSSIKVVNEDSAYSDLMRDIIFWAPTLGSSNMYTLLCMPYPYENDYAKCGKSFVPEVNAVRVKDIGIMKDLILPDDELSSLYNPESEDPMLELMFTAKDRWEAIVGEMGELGEEILKVYAVHSSS
jgi:hypothetical protein